jgi:uncharacterized zinc-type alcohol dehydrogenase-like protein
MKIKVYGAGDSRAPLKPFEYDAGPLRETEVQIKVEYCGICHSDLSMLRNEWGMSSYPFVPGHEVSGVIEEMGARVRHLKAGQRVGLGWYSASCSTCEWCMAGHQNLCPSAQGTIVGRYGGFADRVRADAAWAIPLPDGIDPKAAGPLFCGGITVFNPIVQCDVKPTDRVGVIGIGGLGHMALQFLSAWGCEVTAFSSNPRKEAEARKYGARHFVNSKDAGALQKVAGSFDFILSTVNATLDWNAYLAALRPKGRLHLVGAVPEPLSIPLFSLLVAQKSVSASPLGSPATTARMLEFAARHGIAPSIEVMPFSQANEALSRLEREQPAHRLVLAHG